MIWIRHEHNTFYPCERNLKLFFHTKCLLSLLTWHRIHSADQQQLIHIHIRLGMSSVTAQSHCSVEFVETTGWKWNVVIWVILKARWLPAFSFLNFWLHVGRIDRQTVVFSRNSISLSTFVKMTVCHMPLTSSWILTPKQKRKWKRPTEEK